MSLEDLLDLDVTAASKKREKANLAPAVVHIITAKEISWLGFNTLEEVLEYAVGISSVNGEGNAFTTTTIRGNTLVNYQTNTLLLLDGVPIYSPYHGSFDLLSIPLSSIQQIEIVKGSNSVLYGTNAISAVIDIRTKDKEVSSVKLRAGHFNTMHTESALYKKLGDWTVSAFVDTTSTEGERLIYFDEDGQRLPLRDKLNAHSAIATLGYKGAYLRLQHYERNLPSVKTRGFEPLMNADGEVFLQPERNVENGFLATAGYDRKLSDTALLSARATYYDWALDKHIAEGVWKYSAEQFQSEASLTLDPVDWSSTSVGAVFERQKARRYKSDAGVYDIGKDDRATYTAALYVNGEVKPADTLSLFYGARYYASLYTAVDGNVVHQNVSPRLAAVYAPRKELVVKGIFGQSFRAPTYFEKEVDSAAVKGNPDLAPEKSTSFDLVTTYVFPFMNVSLNFFHQTINDKITRAPVPNDPENRRSNQNVGDVTFDGVELYGKFRIADRIEGFAGHSWILRAVQSAGDGDEETFGYYYRHAFTAGVLAHAARGLSVALSAKHLSKWAGAEGYYLVNGGLIYKPFDDEKLELGLQVNNLLDTDIDLPEIARDRPEVPTIPKTRMRTVYGSISYAF